MMDGTKPIATRTRSRVDLFCIAELEKRKKHKGNSYAGSSQCRSGGKSKDGYDKVLVLDFDVNDLNVEDKSRSSERLFEPVSDEGSCFQRKNCVRSYLDRERAEGERRSGSVDLDRRRHYGFHKKRLEKGKDVDFDDCTTDDDDDSYVDDDNDVDEYDKADGASENADDGDDVDYDHREGEDGDNDGVYDDEEEETNGDNDDYDEDYINYVKVMKPDFVEKKCEGREGGFVKSSSSSYDRGREEEEERHFGSVDWRMDSDLQRKKLEQNKIEIIAIDDSEVNDGDDNEVKGGGIEGGFINRKRSSISCFDEKGAEERETQFGSVDLRGDSGLQRNTLEQEKIEIIDIRDGDDDNEVKGGGFINRMRSLKSYFDGDGEEEGERHFSSADLRRDSGLQSKMLDRGKNEINNIDDCNINAGDDNNDDDNGGTDGDDVGRCDDDEDDGESDASNANNDANDNSDGCDDTDYAGDYEDDGDDDYGDADRDNAAAEGGGTHAAEYDAGLQYDIRIGSGDGSNDYDSGTNGRGLLAVDSKYKPKETKRGLSGGLKNHKEGFPITSAIKVPNISSNVNNENKNNTSADPERKQYNGEEVPVKYTDAKFFIIKASSTANLYKSLKYSLWSSTSAGNKKLDVGYQEAQEKSGNCPVFLFFSVNSSGQFVGLAEMVGPVENGFFRVKWHIIKDIPSNLLKHITLENNHNKPVTESQDTQEVTLKNGLQMLKIFEDHSCNLQDMHFD